MEPVGPVVAVPFDFPRTLRSQRQDGKRYYFAGKLYYRTGTKITPDIPVIVEGMEGVVPGSRWLSLRCASRLTICRCYADVEELDDNSYGPIVIREGSFHAILCRWSPMAVCVEYFKNEMFDRLRRREIEQPSKAYAWAKMEFAKHYPEQAKLFPAFDRSLSSTAYTITKARFPALPTQVNLHEIVLPPELLQAKYRNNAPLLLFKHTYLQGNKHETMIVLGSKYMFELWCNGHVSLSDGTYKTCPHPFMQLYVIHTLVMGRVRPALFCLMTRKDGPAYTILFSRLRDLAIECGHPIAWTTFHCDFEAAVINTIEELFPGVDVKGCWFHFASALFKKMVKLVAGSQVAYADETTGVKAAVKQCFALPFVNPEDDTPLNTLIAIMNEYHALPPPRLNLVPFFTYINNSWIVGHVQGPHIWTVYPLNCHRTTNGVEGYNKVLADVFGTTLNLWAWLERYQEEEHRVYLEVVSLKDGQPGPKTKRKYVRRDDRLRELKIMYLDKQIDELEYVRSLRHIMPY